MSQVLQPATPAITYPLQNPVDLNRHYDAHEKVSDQTVWLQVTDITIADTSSSSVLTVIRFSDTEDEVKNFLLGLPPIPPGTARIYDHLIQSHLEVGEGHNVRYDSRIDRKLLGHLSAVTNIDIKGWDEWNVAKIYPVIDPYQTYVVRDQWNPQTQASTAIKPMMIGTYTYHKQHFHKTMLQFFPINGDSLLILHLHELAPDFVGTTVQTASNPDDSDLRMSLARQILQRNLITRLTQKDKTQFVKVAILECLRQRIFLTTETWSTWLRTNVNQQGVTAIMELRQVFLRLETSMEQLVKTMEYVMTSLETENKWQDKPELQHELLDLRYQCECGRAFAKSLRDISQEDCESRQSAVEIKSAEDSARLTLLAAIFLPLSLSTSLLAMSTRLKNLHVLLYDFVGVAIVLSGLAIVFYGIVRSVRKLSRHAKKPHPNPGEAPYQLRKEVYLPHKTFLSWPLYSLGYVLIAVSFLVGMLKDITIGWKFLVYSIPGVAACLLVVAPVVYKVLIKLKSMVRQCRSLPSASQPAP